jgi:hypothetical protein
VRAAGGCLTRAVEEHPARGAAISPPRRPAPHQPQPPTQLSSQAQAADPARSGEASHHPSPGALRHTSETAVCPVSRTAKGRPTHPVQLGEPFLEGGAWSEDRWMVAKRAGGGRAGFRRLCEADAKPLVFSAVRPTCDSHTCTPCKRLSNPAAPSGSAAANLRRPMRLGWHAAGNLRPRALPRAQLRQRQPALRHHRQPQPSDYVSLALFRSRCGAAKRQAHGVRSHHKFQCRGSRCALLLPFNSHATRLTRILLSCLHTLPAIKLLPSVAPCATCSLANPSDVPATNLRTNLSGPHPTMQKVAPLCSPALCPQDAPRL